MLIGHDMRLRRLHTLLGALAPLALLGCGSSIGPFDGEICLSGDNDIADLSPAMELDYLAIVQTSDGAPEWETTASWGAPCAGAMDEAACLQALEALPVPAVRSLHRLTSTYWGLPFTRGDEVGAVADAGAMQALFGVIDTPTEAALYAFTRGHSIAGCGQKNWRKEGDAFVLRGRRVVGCGDIIDYELTVGPDGSISAGDGEEVASGDCPSGEVARRRPDGPRSGAPGGSFAGIAPREAAAVHASALATALGGGAPVVRAFLRLFARPGSPLW